jgi:hypothetical protein
MYVGIYDGLLGLLCDLWWEGMQLDRTIMALGGVLPFEDNLSTFGVRPRSIKLG